MSSLRGFLRCIRPVVKQTLKGKSCWTTSQPTHFKSLRCFSVSSCRLAERYFAESHEYITVDGDVGTVGISDFAQGQLGDVVFIELPPADTAVEKGGQLGAVESVKMASDIYSPVSGTVEDVNTKVEEEPTLINSSCYDDGWICKIKLSNPEELQELMTEEAYKAFIESEEH